MKKTVIELRAMLAGLPDDMPIEFSVISSAWLGTADPMRVDDVSIFSDLKFALPTDDGARGVIYISEDRSNNK